MCLAVQDAGDGSGDCIVTFPDDLMAEAGWEIGDILEYIPQADGRVRLEEIAQADGA